MRTLITRLTAVLLAVAAPPHALCQQAAPDDERHATDWTDVAPAPETDAPPLLERPGLDADGTPRTVVDQVALRALLARRKFARLSQVIEGFQARFEADPRFDGWLADTYDALGYVHPSERALIDAWQAATPGSFAPHLASAAYWRRAGFLWRGSRLAMDTSSAEFGAMSEAFEKARSEARRALAIRPALVEARRVLMAVDAAGGSREAAEETSAEALRRCPTCYELAVEWLHWLEPRWGGSVEEMEAFVASRPQARSPRLRYLRGHLLLEQARQARADGRLDQATALLDQACALGGDWRFFLARTRRATPGGGRPAASDFEAADALHPGLADVRGARIWEHLQQGRVEEAGQDLLAVLRANPGSAFGRKFHGAVTTRLGVLAWQEAAAGRAESSARLFALARALAPNDRELARDAERAARGEARRQGPDGQAVTPGTPELAVRVVDAAGRPAAGATVAILPGTPEGRQLHALVEGGKSLGRTDAAGSFRGSAAVGTHTVVVIPTEEEPRGAALVVDVRRTGGDAELRLTFAGRLSGLVQDTDQRPVSGVAVLATPVDSGSHRPLRALALARSGPDGRFSMGGLDGGRYVLSVRDGPLRGSSRLLDAAAGIDPGADAVVVRVSGTVRIHGRVMVDEGGVTKAADRFTLNGPLGERTIWATGGRFDQVLEQPGARAGLSFRVEGLPMVRRTVELDGPDVDLGDVLLGPGRVVRGRVVDPAGEAVRGAAVGPPGGRPVTRTGDDGTFELRVEAGPTSLEFTHLRFKRAGRDIRGDEDWIEAALDPAAIIKVRLVDDEGAPIARVPVAASYAVEADDPVKADFATCTTEANGWCQLGGLEAGAHTVKPFRSLPGKAPPPVTWLRVGAQETRELRVRWSSARTRLTVRTLDSDGQPTPAEVRLFEGGPTLEAAQDRTGRSRLPYRQAPSGRALEELAPGTFRVVAFQGQACATTTVVLQAGGDQEVALRLGDGSCR